MESKEIKQMLTLEEVSSTVEIPEKIEPSLKEYKRDVYDKLLETLPPMRDIQHHGTFIFHDFEDPFMWKESVRDESFKFCKFVLPTISMWAKRVLPGMQNFISNHTLKDFLHGSE